MRRPSGGTFKRPLVLLALLGTLACGPSPEPVTPSVASKPGEAAVAATEPTALPPVSEPHSIVASVRLRSPAATMNATSECTRVPVQAFDAGLKHGIEEMMRAMLGDVPDIKATSALIALDAPVDALVALDDGGKPKAIAAVAIGLTSLEGAKRAFEAPGPLSDIAPGVWRIRSARSGSTCAVATSVGATPARLVCGERERDLVALAPYMARTLPTMPVPAADLHGELRWSPAEARFGGELKQMLRGLPILAKAELATGDGRIDAALVTAATALGAEGQALMGDLHKLSFGVGLSPASCTTTVDAALSFRGQSSWFAETIFNRPGRQGPPPAIFWRAPKDSDSAFFARGTDPERFAKILSTLRTVLDAALAKSKIGSAADRKALTDLVTIPFGKDTNSVQATGHFDAKRTSDGSPQGRFDDAVGAIGWYLFGFDESAERIAKLVKDTVAVYNRAGLQTSIKKTMGKSTRFLPGVRLVAAPKELGKGALDVEMITVIEVPSLEPDPTGAPGAKKAGSKTVASSLHLLLMPDGATTWIAFGPHRDELIRRLQTVKSGAPTSGTLAARPGLEALKNGKSMAAGFFTLARFTRPFNDGLAHAAPGSTEAAQLLNMLRNLPNKGETPILFSSRVTVGSSLRSETEIALPKGSIEDLAKFAFALVQMASGTHATVAAP